MSINELVVAEVRVLVMRVLAFFGVVLVVGTAFGKSPPIDPRLMVSVVKGDKVKVVKLVDGGISVTSLEPVSHLILSSPEAEWMIRFFHEKGFEWNRTQSRSVLLDLCKDQKLAALLRSYGAKTFDQLNPIYAYLKLDEPRDDAHIKELIAKSVDLNVPEPYGKTLINQALQRRNLALFGLLVEAGADLSINIHENYVHALELPVETLALLREKSQIPASSLLLSHMVAKNLPAHFQVVIQDFTDHEQAENAMVMVAGAKRSEMIKHLLTEGVAADGAILAQLVHNPELINNLVKVRGEPLSQREKNELLTVSLRKRANTTFEYLVENGAQIKGRENDLLIAACTARPPEVSRIESLIKLGADPSFHNENGLTPLICSATPRGGDVMRALLAYKVDVDHQDNSGATALHYAAQFSLENVLSLVEHNASIDIKDKQGRTALELGLRRGMMHTRLIPSKQVYEGCLVHLAAHWKTQCVARGQRYREFKDFGPDIARTIWFEAIAQKAYTVSLTMMAFGFDPLATDGNGATAAMLDGRSPWRASAYKEEEFFNKIGGVMTEKMKRLYSPHTEVIAEPSSRPTPKSSGDVSGHSSGK